MATPSLRGRLARLGNPRKPVLKPSKPLILANRVGERRRDRGGEQSQPEAEGCRGAAGWEGWEVRASYMAESPHVPCRGDLYHRDVGDDGLLEAE